MITVWGADLGPQSVQFQVRSQTPRSTADLGQAPSRYAVLPAGDGLETMSRLNQHLLAQALYCAKTSRKQAVKLLGSGGLIGVLVYLPVLANAAVVPDTGRLFVWDLLDHIATICPDGVGELLVTNLHLGAVAPLAANPVGIRPGWDDDVFVTQIPDETTLLPKLETCPTNEFYGQAEILRVYVRSAVQVPIPGRLQHGWSPRPLDVLSISDSDRFSGPYYVWSSETADAARAAGVEAHPIGAPYLYLPRIDDPGPVPDTVLALPLHSVRAEKVDNWGAYAAWLREFAAGRKVECCLGYVDHETPGVREVFAAVGIHTFTLGWTERRDLLHRLRAVILRSQTVTSNWICTATMYAAHERRRVVVGGPVSLPELARRAGDRWARDKFPGLFGAGDAVAWSEAERELGVDCFHSPVALRMLLWRWLPI